jgi:hypothetical protein
MDWSEVILRTIELDVHSLGFVGDIQVDRSSAHLQLQLPPRVGQVWVVEDVQVSPHFELASAAVAEEIQEPEQLAATGKIRDRRSLREQAVHGASPVADGGDDRSATLIGPVDGSPALDDRALESDHL